MAVVTTVNCDWQNITGKTLSHQSVLTSKMKEAVVCVAIGACNYPMCDTGYTVDLSLCGRITTIISATPEHLEVSNTLLVAQYVPDCCNEAATGTLHYYEVAAGACPLPMSELPACESCAACTTVKFHIIGF